MRAVASLALVAAASATSIYSLPTAYEVEATFTLPYFNHVEKAYIWADNSNGGVMRASYYGGANVYIMDNRTQYVPGAGYSYAIVPMENALSCTLQPLAGFKSPFPDFDLFTPLLTADGTQNLTTVNGRACLVWNFSYADPEVNAAGGSYNPPNYNVDENGYVGQYFWYQDAVTGAPVRFHTVVGHNVVFGGSHVDEYIVDYGPVTAAAAGWPEDFFHPPQNMPCTAGISPFGPTAAHTVKGASPTASREILSVHGRHEAPAFAIMHPDVDGAVARRELANAHAHAFTEVLGGKGHAKPAVAHVSAVARFVAARNRELVATRATYTIGLNHFAHLTRAEFSRLTGYRATAHKVAAASKDGSWPLGPGLPDDSCSVHTLTGKDQAMNVDLVAQNLVNPPKDQGTCGSCWAFGAIGAIEGAIAKSAGNGKLPTRLSEQQLMDCTWLYGNNGCDGGTDFNAFSWLLQKNAGLVATDASYGAYLNHDGFCHFDVGQNWTTGSSSGKATPGARLAQCIHINNQFNQTSPTIPPAAATFALNDVLANVGVPVSVAIQATLPDFYFYTGGLYYDSECHSDTGSLDHQVLAVGYKTVDGSRYTRIKNSWSNHWGEDGYVWISQADNDCGVATSGTYIIAAPVGA